MISVIYYIKDRSLIMKETWKKILPLFLLCGPFLDMLTAIMLQVFHIDMTLGMIVRSLFLVFCMIYIFFIYRGTYYRKLWLILGAILVYSLIFTIIMVSQKDISVLFYEGKNLIKTFFFPIILLTFLAMRDAKDLTIPRNYFFIIYCIYLLGIFIPSIFQIGFDSYEVTKTGTIGFFNTANEVSAILAILMPFFLYHLYEKRNLVQIVLWGGILLYVLVSIGTKGPLLAFVVIILVWLIYYYVRLIKRKRYPRLAVSSLVLLVFATCFIILLPKTAFYQNIQVHLDFLEVDSISEVFTDEKLLDHFVFSSRLKFLGQTATSYEEASIPQKIFGIGYIENYGQDTLSLKMIEMDYLDIFFRHGIVGSLLYLSIYGYFLVSFFKFQAHQKDTKLKITYLLAGGLSVILALLTGHVLLAPAVSLLVAVLFVDRKEEVV